MKKLFSHIVLCLTVSTISYGQGWVTKDANIVLKNDAHIVIHGKTGNYLNKDGGLITTTPSGTIHVDGDWVNNGSTGAIGNNAGTVMLTGGNQRITGSQTTTFNNLELSGGGIKSLQVATLVGGGYNTTRLGVLNLNDRHLLLNSQLLIINNNTPSALIRTTGLLIGETDPTIGYSKVQWNLRNVGSGNVFFIPFGTTDFIHIPFQINVRFMGTQIADSGFVAVATYPTSTLAAPNNRPLPIGVAHMDNRYKLENDLKSLDRFFILSADGYSKSPTVKFGFPYVDREWDGLLGGGNDIIEKDIKPARFDVTANAWDFTTDGVTNVSNNNTLSDNLTNISGAWVLQNFPNCPVPNFTFNNACYLSPILFTDSSYIQKGSIDTSVWVYEKNELYSQNLLLHTFNADGLYDIKRKVRGERGCWDSITKTVQVYPLPNSSFVYSDTCTSDVTRFASTSKSSVGMPLKHQWLIGAKNYVIPNPNHKFATDGVKSIQLISQNTLGCYDTLLQDINVEPLPTVKFGFYNICERQEAYFFDSTETMGTVDEWQWRTKGKVASYFQDHNQTFNTAGNYKVQLTAKNSFGCKDSLQRIITVWPKAKAKFDQFPKDIYITDPFVNFIQSGADANWWQWDFGDFSPEEFGPEVLHQYQDTGIFRARLIANNDFKCADTFFRTIIIKPNLRIYIPNAFSPGPDNDVNTTFGPGGMLYGIKSLDMTIYTRWGELIYHSDHIDKPWDGMYMGELVQEGTYLYLIKIKDIYNDVFRYSGTLTVIR
ncbi:MAG: gliding motility-associated-like protein [Bacteroidia bacterium]|jgi:gliding motility-associated-like protein